MLSAISIQRKDEALLPQTIETTEKGLTDPGKTATRIKVVLSTTKKTQKKKKFLKSVLDEAASVLFFVLCLSPGGIVVVVLMLLVDINLISRISPGLHWRHPLPVREAGSLRERQLEAVH